METEILVFTSIPGRASPQVREALIEMPAASGLPHVPHCRLLLLNVKCCSLLLRAELSQAL